MHNISYVVDMDQKRLMPLMFPSYLQCFQIKAKQPTVQQLPILEGKKILA